MKNILLKIYNILGGYLKVEKKPLTSEVIINMPEKDQVDVLDNLRNSQGWKIIVKIMKDNARDLEEKIVNKVDGERVLNNDDVDQLRYKRGYLLDLINTPDRLIDKINNSDVETNDYNHYDPYEA